MNIIDSDHTGGGHMTTPVVLAPKLDLAAASSLMTTLRASEDDEIIIDMSEVKHIGALCMQVLLSIANDLNSNGRKMTITDVSDRVIDQLRVMGMTPESIAKGTQ